MAGMGFFAAQMAEGMEEEEKGRFWWLKRYQKKVSHIMHAPYILIIVSCLAILDATFVVGQLILDLIIVRQLFEKNIEYTRTLSVTLNDTYYPDFACFGGDHYDTGSVEDLVSFLSHGDDHGNETDASAHRRKRGLQEAVQSNKALSKVLFTAMRNLPLTQMKDLCAQYPSSKTSNALENSQNTKSHLGRMFSVVKQRIQKRAVVNDTHISTNDKGNGTDNHHNDTSHAGDAGNHGDHGDHGEHGGHSAHDCPHVEHHGHHAHDLPHTLAHICHIGSLTVLTIMVTEKLIRLSAFGKAFFKNKLQVFDSVVVILSWIVDLYLIEGIWSQSAVEAALILIILLPWRVIRIVNCFVMTFKERYKIRIRILEEKTKAAQKKAENAVKQTETLKKEVKLLRDLAKLHGATDEDIEICKTNANDSLKRKKGMYLNSLAQITAILGSTITTSQPNGEGGEEKKDDEKDGHIGNGTTGNGVAKQPDEDADHKLEPNVKLDTGDILKEEHSISKDDAGLKQDLINKLGPQQEDATEEDPGKTDSVNDVNTQEQRPGRTRTNSESNDDKMFKITDDDAKPTAREVTLSEEEEKSDNLSTLIVFDGCKHSRYGMLICSIAY
ncbi:unnamed protein product [Owenia fusiformis]|uniref:Voltage-gated hydrogen channel 1 n=1 Tax=Owenia fusiformis TaxID=6347 RepID=A0A8S4NUM4_OWEFU|nr:unnamed protein product [Owenia fusiformis]